MKILFLGDIVGDAGFKSVKKNLPSIVSKKGIDFVCVNGENAASEGVGLTENIANELFNVGVDVITTGNHVWDQKEIYEYIKTCLLYTSPSPRDIPLSRMPSSA